MATSHCHSQSSSAFQSLRQSHFAVCVPCWECLCHDDTHLLCLMQVKNNETSPVPPTKPQLVAGALTNLTRDVISQPLQLPLALSDLNTAIKG